MFVTMLNERDPREAGQLIRTSFGRERLTESELIELFDIVPVLRDRYRGSDTVEVGREKVVWHDYEHLIWDLGEQFRQAMKQQRVLRRSSLLWGRIEALCVDRSNGKGRQSFTMLMGLYGGSDRVPVLVRLVGDSDVCGHAVGALRRLGAPEGVEAASGLLAMNRSWIRREVLKYLEKIDPQLVSAKKGSGARSSPARRASSSRQDVR